MTRPRRRPSGPTAVALRPWTGWQPLKTGGVPSGRVYQLNGVVVALTVGVGVGEGSRARDPRCRSCDMRGRLVERRDGRPPRRGWGIQGDEFGAELVGVGVVEVVEDGQGLLPGGAGGALFAGAV